MKKTKMDQADLAEQLRDAIRESGYSINSLANVWGIPQPVLSRFVSGQRGIGMDNANKIAAAFGMRLTKPKTLRIEPD